MPDNQSFCIRISKVGIPFRQQRVKLLRVVAYREVLIEAQKNLLRVGDPVSWWERAITLLGGEVLAVRANHVSVLAGLPDLHRDPFDRMLISQAFAEGIVLLTGDEQVSQYPVKSVW
jgi:PIN domain nuclease of toxin-antitoxin system